jgi:hypothetical protein
VFKGGTGQRTVSRTGCGEREPGLGERRGATLDYLRDGTSVKVKGNRKKFPLLHKKESGYQFLFRINLRIIIMHLVCE